MKYLLVLLLALPVGADILIGDKPCLWKRPITAYRDHYRKLDTGSTWDKPIIRHHLREKWPNCDKKTDCWTVGTKLDTVSWETYWDSCGRGKK